MTQKKEKNKKALTETHEWHVKKRRVELKVYEEIENFGKDELHEMERQGDSNQREGCEDSHD
jgi:hypothetical protein